MPQAVVLIGSNSLAEVTLPAAEQALCASDTLRVLAVSAVIRTHAVMASGAFDESAPPYHNAAILIETALRPLELRTVLRAIEYSLGRRRIGNTSAAVPIDLDLAVYDDLVLTEGPLILPHPAIERYAFAAVPVAQVAPDWVHPTLGRTYSEIAAEMVAPIHTSRRVS